MINQHPLQCNTHQHSMFIISEYIRKHINNYSLFLQVIQLHNFMIIQTPFGFDRQQVACHPTTVSSKKEKAKVAQRPQLPWANLVGNLSNCQQVPVCPSDIYTYIYNYDTVALDINQEIPWTRLLRHFVWLFTTISSWFVKHSTPCTGGTVEVESLDLTFQDFHSKSLSNAVSRLHTLTS